MGPTPFRSQRVLTPSTLPPPARAAPCPAGVPPQQCPPHTSFPGTGTEGGEGMCQLSLAFTPSGQPRACPGRAVSWAGSTPPPWGSWTRFSWTDPPGCLEVSLLGGKCPLHTVLGAGSWNWKLRVLEPPFRITGTCGEGPGGARSGSSGPEVSMKGGRDGCQGLAVHHGGAPGPA